MKLALAASILAQTLPIASSVETKSSVHLTRAARHHHLHDLLVKLNKNDNNDDEPKTEEFAVSTPWLAKRLAHGGGGGGPGVLKNRAIVAKNVECDPAYPHANEGDDHKEADVGILFHAPKKVIDEFPQFPAVNDFEALKKEFIKASNRNLN